VMRRHFPNLIAIILPTLLGITSCASGNKEAESVKKVDDLLTRIERVQVEAVVSKEATHAALEQLELLTSPVFSGDAKLTFTRLVELTEDCEKQADALRSAVRPMSDSAESVFRQWASDLESFGNTRLRQRSQARLDETRARYQSVLNASQSAMLAFDTFNGDLQDHALYLGNDLNAGAVSSLTPEVQVLREQIVDLDARFDNCGSTARLYIESAALYGEVEGAEAQAAPQTVEKTAPAQPQRRRTTAPAKQRPTGAAQAPTAPPPTPVATPVVNPPVPTPAPGSQAVLPATGTPEKPASSVAQGPK
jgi:ElaB/YqjD/DUF883 family membrane-anchored ribosome-binding protein